MIGRRNSPDGLPFRLYYRKGKLVTSYGYKLSSGKWAFRLKASNENADALALIRKEAIERAEVLNGKTVEAGTLEALAKKYFAWQESLSPESGMRKAAITLKENRVEGKRLEKVFGKMMPKDIKPKHIYGYLSAREKMGAPAKANKEIALLSAIVEYGRRLGWLELNPCRDIQYNKTTPSDKTVEWADLQYALAEARSRGGSYLVLALCFMTAYMTVGRANEMRALTRQAMLPEGMKIPIGKRRGGQVQKYKLIEWSPELRSTIDEAISLQRTSGIYIFGNSSGQVYTRSGWGTIWARLMAYCETRAKVEGVQFTKFALTHMRPTSVTDRMEAGDEATAKGEATGHSSSKMVQTTYDRRRIKKAKATPLKG